jgi:hypothetical protein
MDFGYCKWQDIFSMESYDTGPLKIVFAELSVPEASFRGRDGIKYNILELGGESFNPPYISFISSKPHFRLENVL